MVKMQGLSVHGVHSPICYIYNEAATPKALGNKAEVEVVRAGGPEHLLLGNA